MGYDAAPGPDGWCVPAPASVPNRHGMGGRRFLVTPSCETKLNERAPGREHLQERDGTVAWSGSTDLNSQSDGARMAEKDAKDVQATLATLGVHNVPEQLVANAVSMSAPLPPLGRTMGSLARTEHGRAAPTRAGAGGRGCFPGVNDLGAGGAAW